MHEGDWVRVRSRRPLTERFDGMVGEIKTYLPQQRLVYVHLGQLTPIFYLDEIEPTTPPQKI